jgi:twitching motility protein PilJ
MSRPYPSEVGADFKSGLTQYGVQEEVAAPVGSEKPATDLIALPVLGRKTIAQHQRILSIALVVSLVLLALVTLVGLNRSEKAAQQLSATGQSLMQSQRLAKSVSQALVGDAKAFADVAQSAQILVKSVRGLMNGDADLRLDQLGAGYKPLLDKVAPMADPGRLVPAPDQSPVVDLLEIAETVSRHSSCSRTRRRPTSRLQVSW